MSDSCSYSGALGIIVVLVVTFFWGVVLAAAQEPARAFRAAVVKIDITPETSQMLRGYGPRESEGVHDPIFHRILAMDDGETDFYLISSDLGGLSRVYVDKILKDLDEETGIGLEHVWWTITHTHSAPYVGTPGLRGVMWPDRMAENARYADPNPEYSAKISRQLIEGIKEARAKLERARLGVGIGMSMAAINRRAIDVDGTASLGFNPDGPVDRRIGLIRVDRLDGSPIALVVNYAMHGTVLGSRNLEISGDAQGVVAAYVEEKLGAPMLYINGAAGDVAPIYSTEPNFRAGHITQFNVLLGDKILAANRLITTATEEVKLHLSQVVVESPKKEGLGWLPELANYKRTTSAGVEMIRIPVGFLRINDEVLFWSAPLELFNEIATEVRMQSPYAHTFFFGYTNGWWGYLPTRAAFSQGGYETGHVTPFTERVEDDFTEGVITYINSLSR